MRALRLGTRGSLLAVTQSQWVADRVSAASGHPVELVIVRTRGDEATDRPLAMVGGKGLFTKELEAGLLDGSIDFAVHSLKDLPTEDTAGLVLAAVNYFQMQRGGEAVDVSELVKYIAGPLLGGFAVSTAASP